MFLCDLFRIEPGRKILYLEATTDIAEGNEILWDYGISEEEKNLEWMEYRMTEKKTLYTRYNGTYLSLASVDEISWTFSRLDRHHYGLFPPDMFAVCMATSLATIHCW